MWSFCMAGHERMQESRSLTPSSYPPHPNPPTLPAPLAPPLLTHMSAIWPPCVFWMLKKKGTFQSKRKEGKSYPPGSCAPEQIAFSWCAAAQTCLGNVKWCIAILRKQRRQKNKLKKKKGNEEKEKETPESSDAYFTQKEHKHLKTGIWTFFLIQL